MDIGRTSPGGAPTGDNTMYPIDLGQIAKAHELLQRPTFLHLPRERLVRRYHGDGVECPAEVMLPVTRDLELIKYSSVSNA
jgi:hypothetical protein